MFSTLWVIILLLSAFPAVPLTRWAWQFRHGVGPQGQDVWFVFVFMFAALWAVLGGVNGFLAARGLNLAWLVKYAAIPPSAGIMKAVVLVAGLMLAANARDTTTGHPVQLNVWASVIVLAVLFAVQIGVGVRFSR